MRSFSWLHFTDLHQGLESQGWLWPGVRDVLFADLEQLHRRCGPWDLVLFSGDLTQRGRVEEFNKFNATLTQLYSHLRALGSTPSLLAVPGNHDLMRPDARRPRPSCSAAGRPTPRSRASSGATPVAVPQARRAGVRPVHRLARRPPVLRRAAQTRHAARRLLGGARPDGLRLGIVGLNSAFLQISGANFEGKLAVDVRQFHAACDGDGPAWVKANDFSLLMTHHPPDWLSPRRASTCSARSSTPGRFNAHIFGHMHEHMATTLSVGGAAPRRQIQGNSLFGLETFGDGKLDRRHGYAAGKHHRRRPRRGQPAIWPRVAKKHAAGHWRIVQDLDAFELGDDQATRPEPLPFTRKPPPPPISSTPHPEPRASISQTAPIPDMVITSLSGNSTGDSGIYYAVAVRVQPPGAPYSQSWHVNRTEEERTALNYLDQPGAPVVLWGPEKFGKTWTSQYLTNCVIQQDGGDCRVIAINFDTFDHESRADYASFIRELAFQIVGAIGGPEDWVPTLWKTHGSVNQKLGRLMRDNVLPLANSRVIVAFDRVDAVWGLPFKDDCFGMLRAWAQDARLGKLRLILGISTTPGRLIDRPTQSPFNLTPPIVLGDFSRAQVEQLAHLYSLTGPTRTSRP
jgi:hypothetical protein